MKEKVENEVQNSNSYQKIKHVYSEVKSFHHHTHILYDIRTLLGPGGFTITLPVTTRSAEGRMIYTRNNNEDTPLTLAVENVATDLIDLGGVTSTSITFNKNESYIIQYDSSSGTNTWYVVVMGT